MSGILRDGTAQLALMLCGFALLSLALVGFEVLRVTWRKWRDGLAETAACARIGAQQALGLNERLTGEQIAERAAARR